MTKGESFVTNKRQSELLLGEAAELTQRSERRLSHAPEVSLVGTGQGFVKSFAIIPTESQPCVVPKDDYVGRCVMGGRFYVQSRLKSNPNYVAIMKLLKALFLRQMRTPMRSLRTTPD